jgi:hypothetical protein
MARPLEPRVDGTGVTAVRFGEGRPQPIVAGRRHDQVDMIAHQAISQIAARARRAAAAIN